MDSFSLRHRLAQVSVKHPICVLEIHDNFLYYLCANDLGLVRAGFYGFLCPTCQFTKKQTPHALGYSRRAGGWFGAAGHREFPPNYMAT